MDYKHDTQDFLNHSHGMVFYFGMAEINSFTFVAKPISLIEKQHKIKGEERAVLVGLVQKDQTYAQVEEYLDELAFLADTAGATSV